MRIFEYLIEKNDFLVKQYNSKILAAYERDDLAYSKNPDATPEEIVDELQKADVKNKYLQWIVRQYVKGDFRLEDLNRVNRTLKHFDSKKKQLQIKDIGQYRQLSQLQVALDELSPTSSKRQEKMQIKSEGVDKIVQTNHYLVLHIKTEEAAKYYGKGTEWCTAGDNNNRFESYNKQGPLYIIIDRESGRKWQLHDETQQFMDENDSKINQLDFSRIYEDDSVREFLKEKTPNLVPLILFSAEDVIKLNNPRLAYRYYSEVEPHSGLVEVFKTSPVQAADYASRVIRGRWVEAEPYIKKDPMTAASYANFVLKRPWPEAEPYIIQDARASERYAFLVLHKRWPEAEPTILKNRGVALNYANTVIQGRWPELEELLLNEPAILLSHYARMVIRDRWREVEDIIMKDPAAALYYSRHVLKRRWRAAEPYIMKNDTYWHVYVSHHGPL